MDESDVEAQRVARSNEPNRSGTTLALLPYPTSDTILDQEPYDPRRWVDDAMSMPTLESRDYTESLETTRSSPRPWASRVHEPPTCSPQLAAGDFSTSGKNNTSIMSQNGRGDSGAGATCLVASQMELD